MWTLLYGYYEDRTPTHGYEATREAAMAAFAKSWRRESYRRLRAPEKPERGLNASCRGEESKQAAAATPRSEATPPGRYREFGDFSADMVSRARAVLAYSQRVWPQLMIGVIFVLEVVG
jgi:hypothetical protein